MNNNKRSNEQEIRMRILTIFDKLRCKSTVTVAYDMFREIVKSYITQENTIVYILSLVAENFKSTKVPELKDALKLVSHFTIFLTEEEAFPFISRLLTLLQTNISDNNSSIFTVISEVFAEVVSHCLKSEISDQVVNEEHKRKNKKVYEMFQGFCIYNMKQDTRANQICGSLCLTALIETCPLVLQPSYMKYIWENIVNLIDKNNFHAKLELLNGLISLIFASETLFKPFANVTLYKILDFLTDGDWLKRKLSLNVVYTLVYYCQEEILPLKSHIIEFLKVLKSDKIKEVREVCLQTLKFFNEEEEEMAAEVNSNNETEQHQLTSNQQINNNESERKQKVKNSNQKDKSPNTSFTKIETKPRALPPKAKRKDDSFALDISDIKETEDRFNRKNKAEVKREKNIPRKSLTPSRRSKVNVSSDDITGMNISKSNINQINRKKEDNSFINSKMIIKRNPNHSIFNTKVNQEFFSNKPEIEILVKDKQGVRKETFNENKLGYKTDSHIPNEELDNYPKNSMRSTNSNIAESKLQDENKRQEVEKAKDEESSKVEVNVHDEIIHGEKRKFSHNESKDNYDQENKQSYSPKKNHNCNTGNTNNTNTISTIPEILKQLKHISDKQIFLLNSIDSLQTNTDDQISQLSAKIQKLESTVIYLSNYIKTHIDSQQQYNTNTSTNPNGCLINTSPYQTNRVSLVDNTEYESNREGNTWQEVTRHLKSNNPTEAFNLCLNSEESILLKLIRNININQIKGVLVQVLEDTVTRLLMILARGEEVSNILTFIKMTLILMQSKFKSTTIINIKDILNYLEGRKNQLKLKQEDISEISLILSQIK